MTPTVHPWHQAIGLTDGEQEVLRCLERQGYLAVPHIWHAVQNVRPKIRPKMDEAHGRWWVLRTLTRLERMGYVSCRQMPPPTYFVWGLK